MAKRIIAIVLFLSGFFIYLFFYKYNGTLIPYSWAFYLLGLILWVTGIFLLRNSKSINNIKAIEQLKIIVNDLKNSGEKIVVDLSKCEIKENNYSEERPRDNYPVVVTPIFTGDIEFFDGIYDNRYNTKTVDVNQSVLIYKHLHNGVEEKFISKVIPRTKEDLNFKFYLQKNTMLYVDKNNRKRYYFDLAFLNPEE
jgi:hypothetical protein